MLCKSLLAAVMLLATSAVASPLQKRYSDVTCGSTVYYAASIEKAVNAGCSYYQSSTEAGSSDYPHKYNNYEGFDFPVSGPYQEFPVEKGYAYSGGSPGASRVIFNSDCTYAGSITHDGASGDDFVGCSDVS